jgi:hypothetical protein
VQPLPPVFLTHWVSEQSCSAAGDFKQQSGGFAEEMFWLMGPDRVISITSVPAHAPAETERLFANAGYYIRRSGWGPRDSHLIFDGGDLGMLSGVPRSCRCAGHPALRERTEVLLDPGTFVYNGDPESRELLSLHARAQHRRDRRPQSGTAVGHVSLEWKISVPYHGPAAAEHVSIQA